MKNTIIIGAGIGGLCTGIRLLDMGYSVKIIEKEGSIGGKVNCIKENGFKFDYSASIVMMPNVYTEIFREMGKDYRKYFQWERIEPIYKVYYDDKTIYEFYSEISKTIQTLEKISKRDSIGYLKFISKAYEKYIIAEEGFFKKPMDELVNLFNIESIEKALEINPLSSSYNFVSKYIKNKKLVDYICFQSMYVGISPYEGSNIYTLIPAVSQLYGLWYIKGGMYSYVKALEKLFLEMGGEIELNNEVKEIIVTNDSVDKVLCSNGELRCDIVVCNEDFPKAIRELICSEHKKRKYSSDNIEKLKYSCSTFILYLGLNKKYSNLEVHNFYLVDKFKESIECAFKGKISENPCMYMYCPSRVDETLAPIGNETINIMIRVPNLIEGNIIWNDDFIKYIRNIVISQIKNIDGLEDIEEHIVYENYSTPKDLEKRFNSYAGAAFGLSHTLTQTNYFRPHVKYEEVEALYFVGSSVHPGSGVSIVCEGSKIIENLEKNK